MLASLADSTLTQYSVTYKLWWQFCTDKQIDVFTDSSSYIILFLSYLYSKSKGCSHGTLNSHRSALSLLLGSNVVTNDVIKRLLKGAYKLKPSTLKYTCTWDPQIVQNYLSSRYPNINLSLEQISKKLITLLAICTAHRVQTFSLIKINNIIQQ